MKWRCPNATTSTAFYNRLICKAEMKEGVNYNDKSNFFDVICMYQKECKCDERVYNTEQGKKCYLLKRERALAKEKQ